MQVPPPALRVLEPPRHPADPTGHLVAGIEIAVHALRGIEPVLLTGMGGEGPTLRRLHTRRVNEQVGRDRPAEAVAEAVGHCMVDGHVAGAGRHRRVGHEIRRPAGEGRGHRQSRGVHVVFHVILRRVREHDPGPCPPHDRRDPPQQPLFVEDQQVGGEALVTLRAQDARRRAGLTGPGATGLLPRHRHAAAVAVGDVEIVDRPARVAEQEERAGGIEFDVVGVGDDRQRGGPLVMAWWRLGCRLDCCHRFLSRGCVDRSRLIFLGRRCRRRGTGTPCSVPPPSTPLRALSASRHS